MSTITGVGLRLGIFGPPPQPPQRSLLKTAGVVKDLEERYLGGVNQVGYPIPLPAVWTPCEVDPTKGTDSAGLADTFDPFAVYIEVTCTTAAYDGLLERGIASLEASSSYGVEYALAAGVGGVGGNTNPFFGDSNVTILGGGAMPPREAMALLEDDIGRKYAARGMIHASPGTVDLLSSILEEQDDGTIYTQAGTPVVPGMGYIDASADGHAPADATQQYMFATGPVEVRMTPINAYDLPSALDRSLNEVSFIVERYVLANFDRTVQSAVLVDFDLASS